MLLSADNLLDDVLASLNAGELAQRRFREIARVAGLIFQGYPGAPKSTRQLQASSGLFYEVFRKYDAGNLLLAQAEREVLEQELDLERLRAALTRMRAQQIVYRRVMQPDPVRFSAADRDAARAGDHRETRRAHRADGGGAGAPRRRGVAPKKRFTHFFRRGSLARQRD